MVTLEVPGELDLPGSCDQLVFFRLSLHSWNSFIPVPRLRSDSQKTPKLGDSCVEHVGRASRRWP